MIFLNANDILITSITQPNRLFFLSKLVQFKLMIVLTKEDASHKEVVGVTEKHKYAVEVQIYDVPIRNAWVVDVDGVAIDIDNLC